MGALSNAIIMALCFSQVMPQAYAHSSWGSGLEPISPDQRLHLVGSGLQNRSTGDSIALACVNECTQIRFVYFRVREKDAYFYGSPIVVKSVTNEASLEEIKEAVKQENKKYQKTLREEKKKKLGERRVWVFMLMFTTGAVLYGTGMGTVALGLSRSEMLSGMALLWAGGAAVLALIENKPLFSSRAEFTEAFYDQNGWNWGVAPRKIRSKKFESFISFSDPNRELDLLFETGRTLP